MPDPTDPSSPPSSPHDGAGGSATGGPSGPCRVLIDGQERSFASLEALAAAAEGLGLEGATRVSLPGRRDWVAAREVPALAAALSEDDPWAAWDALEDAPASGPVAPAPPPAAPVVPSVPELSSDHVDPLALAEPVTSDNTGRQRFVVDSSRGPRAPRPSARPGRRPPSAGPAAPPAAPEAPRAQAGTGARGNVIAFPTPPGAPVDGPHALAPLQLEPLSLPIVEVPPPPPPRSGTRWGRLVAFAVVVFVFVGSLAAWIRHNASQRFDAPLRPAPQLAAAPEPAAAARPPTPLGAPPPLPAAQEADDFQRLEDELRARMRPRPQEVSQAGDLADALYVEFSRMNLEDLRVEAEVIGWAGRKPPVPKVAEVVVRFRSRGELDRELAAVGLVMGKYVQAYNMQVPRLEAIVEGIDELPRRQSIRAEQARLFYVERLGLVEFLSGMRK